MKKCGILANANPIMRTLNLRLAAICLVVVVLLSGGVHLLHGFQVGRQAGAFKVASQRAEAAKNLNEAIRLLEYYITLVPKDRQQQLHLGLLYAKVFNARGAFVELEEVLRTADASLSPEDLREARRKLVDVFLMMYPRRWQDAELHMNILLKETPNDPELLDLYGQILVGNGKDELACQQFRKAVEIAPTQINSYVRLAFILHSRLDRKADADLVMQDMIHHKVKVKDKDGKDVEFEVNAKSVEAFKKYAYWLREQERFDEALVQAKRVLELVPEDPAGLFVAGCCYLAKGQGKTGQEAKALYKTAEDYLNRGIKAGKTTQAMYKVMADVKNRLGRHDESVAILRMGLENTKGTPGYAEILWDVVNSNIIDGKLDEAEKNIKELQDLRSRRTCDTDRS